MFLVSVRLRFIFERYSINGMKNLLLDIKLMIKGISPKETSHLSHEKNGEALRTLNIMNFVFYVIK